ncbi:acid protease [Plenodomus tracheiphilus IPT5]|uniref:Acid protease n=1 Tax=Plenodomus tracheiphilus IPT5 TaxID=1408161 RepID=A0A6A7B1Y4_9PLEO|nr:acid protease [Plenodomus tracheiphilus IPT5]
MLLSRATRGSLLTTGSLFAVLVFLPCIAAEYLQQNITNATGYNVKLRPGVASIPAPVSVAPDQDWMGIDGSWNTFSLFIGEPRQNARVLVSTASQQIWAVNRLACVSNITDPSTGQVTQYNVLNSECENSRGLLFNVTESSTWTEKGYYQLWVEKALGLAGNGLYGFDSVAMGFPGEEGPSTLNSTIGTLVSANFWLGHIGVHHKPTNFSAFEAPVPSYLMNLFDQGSIPSMSFGYTAGAQYHGQTVLGSLTLGGYDSSRIVPNDLTFIFAPNNERDLVVGVAGLTANTTKQSNIDLLKRNDLNMFIDSTVAELWLPVEICQAFEEAFELQYDADTDLYLVNDALHEKLLAQNPSLTFTLGQQYRTDSTVQITLPYAALDLVAAPPYRGLQEHTRYFPIRRGNMTSQWVLGRTFLQEAYLTVDWERQNFSLSAIDWTFGNPIDLRAIIDTKYLEPPADQSEKSGLSSQVIIGVSVGSVFIFVFVLSVFGWCLWRRRRKQKLEANTAQYEADLAAAAASKKANTERLDKPPSSPVQEHEDTTMVFPKAELPGVSTVHHIMGNREKESLAINEVDGTERQIYEMPGDVPEPQEAGGRQLSEKETMVVRERMYNGFDPNNTPGVSPIGDEAPRRLAPVSPTEVTLLNGRMPSHSNVSPITPRTPRDGALLEASDTFFQLPPYQPRSGRRTEAEDELLSPISPLESSTDTSRRRFSYES